MFAEYRDRTARPRPQIWPTDQTDQIDQIGQINQTGEPNRPDRPETETETARQEDTQRTDRQTDNRQKVQGETHANLCIRRDVACLAQTDVNNQAQ